MMYTNEEQEIRDSINAEYLLRVMTEDAVDQLVLDELNSRMLDKLEYEMVCEAGEL